MDWPIIVGGCHRSGTSLVRRLLNAHSRIHCGAEVMFFRDFMGDYRGDHLHHLRFMSTARSLVGDEAVLDITGRAFIKLHELAARRAGKARWADKNPDNVLYLSEWERLLGDRWLLIHVIRNPLDTLSSMSEANFPLTLPYALDERIAMYIRDNEAALDFAAVRPDRYVGVLYEDLVRSPEDELQRLMTSVGEVWERAQLTFNEQHHDPGLEDPKIATTGGIHPLSVGRWRESLSGPEAAEVTRGTAELWSRVNAYREHAAGLAPVPVSCA
jgi:hypothetical protein